MEPAVSSREEKACTTCGRPFVPTRPRQGKCPLHDAPVARARQSYQSPEWRRTRRAELEETTRCAWCGSTHRLTLHHLDPKVEGGSDQHTLWLCGPDHSSYEADERYDRDTPLRRFVHAAAAEGSM